MYIYHSALTKMSFNTLFCHTLSQLSLKHPFLWVWSLLLVCCWFFFNIKHYFFFISLQIIIFHRSTSKPIAFIIVLNKYLIRHFSVQNTFNIFITLIYIIIFPIKDNYRSDILLGTWRFHSFTSPSADVENVTK